MTELTSRGDGPPILHLADARQLPPLEDVAAWTHVHVTGPLGGETPWQVARREPGRVVARALSPRRLRADTAYLAALVPTFGAGVAAGLGEAVDPAGALLAAWGPQSTGLRLPVLYHWRFATGASGGFASLVGRLKPMAASEVDPAVGRRNIDAGDPGLGVPVAARTLAFGGALRAATVSEPAWDPADRQAFRSELATVLNAPATAHQGQPRPGGPPLYGQWHAAARTVDESHPGWLGQLNLDPRHRATAAAGTQVVQRLQEDLMAAAWRQIGDVEAANALLRRAQLARAAGTALLDSRLAPLGDEAFLMIAGPLLARVPVAGQLTALGRVAQSRVEPAALSAAMRRLTRPGAPFGRRLRLGPYEGRHLLVRLNARERPRPDPRPTGGGGAWLPADLVAHMDPPGRPQYAVIDEDAPHQDRPGPPGTDSPEGARFRTAVGELQGHLVSLLGAPAQGVAPVLDDADLRRTVEAAIDPELTVTRRIGARLSFADQPVARADPLKPVMAHPSFPTPMVDEVVRLSPELLLPGLDKVPAESIIGLQTDSAFVEAFLVGLNHQMGRELLWRGYPTDQRGTYFRRFWDRSRTVPKPAETALDDVATPMAEWAPGDLLGSHLRGAGSTVAEMTVVLIRGMLLRRYPGAVIYLAEAAWDTAGRRAPTNVTLHPTIRGSLDPDVVYLGFDVLPADASGDPDPAEQRPGWFLVFQEQPSELRFGLRDAPGTSGTPTAGALAWQHFGDADMLTYAPVKGVDGSGWPDPWGPDSARIAKAVRIMPLRLAIHADDILP